MAELEIVKLPHHKQENLCETRPAYRQGRKLTAVKVYTINNESRHLIVSGVPKLQLLDQIKKLFNPYGQIKTINLLKNYPCDQFEEAFHIHYGRIQSARIAKNFIDRKNFYGGLLHVFYAPELETVNETREKLAQRFKDVTIRIERHKKDPINPRHDPFIPVPIEFHNRKIKHPARVPVIENCGPDNDNENTNMKPYLEKLPLINEVVKPSESLLEIYNSSSVWQPPYQETDAILKQAGVQEIKIIPSNVEKRKNYKGRTIDDKMVKRQKMKIDIVDTTSLLQNQKKNEKEKDTKNYFVNVKKSNKEIIIKIPQNVNTTKRIVKKNLDSTPLVKPSSDLETSIRGAKKQIREVMLNHIVKDNTINK